MAKALLIAAAVLALILFLGWLAARTAPVCRCGREDCGGG